MIPLIEEWFPVVRSAFFILLAAVLVDALFAPRPYKPKTRPAKPSAVDLDQAA